MQSSLRVGLIQSIFSADSSRAWSAARMRALCAILLLIVVEGAGTLLLSQGAELGAVQDLRSDTGRASDLVLQPIDNSKLMLLANHHPRWAEASNRVRELAAGETAPSLIMVLARSPQREAEFQALLARQQDPASTDYHHWLTPAQIGERFGLSRQDVASVTGWLESQGLEVKYVSPSRTFLGFGGSVARLERAFHTGFGIYNVRGTERMSVTSDPFIPAALAPVVKAIRGLYAIDDQPLHEARTMHRSSPDLSLSNGDHFLTPQDFATIYDLPPPSGLGQTIGIVGRSRTDFADFDQFRQKTGSEFSDPVEIIPTALGGVDPGPAYTAPPPTGTSIEDQLEATLDVMRAGSVANEAQVDLVVATNASGGIAVSAEYLVETTPVPVQTMNISFGNCELNAGASGVAFWDSLFQQAAGEGISVFVSSGDAGASGCDTNFDTPPASPEANSPNYICSSSYATCVGGTELNDTGNPAEYWSTSNSASLGSALSYIPEGAWNEPIDAKGVTHAASGGGGVSSVIATPSWQTGTGVPSARTGRYTPDLAFSASGHDGYFACFAAAGASCVANAEGEYEFEYFYGTSAAAPGMAGITALLNQHIGASQGNLNPLLYPLAASSPSTFHDVTVATSGVSGCVVTTPSMCNNSIPGPTGLSGGQPGYLVGAGYDEATGLGSLDVSSFLNHFSAPPTIDLLASPTLVFGTQLIGSSLTGQDAVKNSGSSSLNPLQLTMSGANAKDFSETDDCTGTLPAGSACTIVMTFTPTASGQRTASLTITSSNASNSPKVISLSGTGESMLPTPTVLVLPSPNVITSTQTDSVQVLVESSVVTQILPTGTVTITCGSYQSPAVQVNADETAVISVPAGVLPLGNDVITAEYSGDSIFPPATGTGLITVNTPVAPGFTITGTSVSEGPGEIIGDTSTITLTPAGGFTGTVTLTAAVTASPANGSYPPTVSFGSTGSVAIAGTTNGSATLTISTTAPTVCGQSNQRADSGRNAATPLLASGGAALAGVFLLGCSRSRRRRIFALLVLLVASALGVTACGGSGGGAKGTCNVATPGTTAGSYTITVTGTSGSLSSTGTVALTVQ